MRTLIFAIVALLALPALVAANETRTMTLPDGTKLQYVLVLPNGFDPSQTYEGLLAFPGGDQSIERAITTMQRFWEPEAVKRGVVVVVPAAPTLGRPFYMGEGSVNLIPDIVATMRATFPIKEGPMHVGGHSNGGVTAFRAAIRWPELFQSLTVIAGTPAERPDTTRMDRLKGMKISMFVGASDHDWLEPMGYVHLVLEEMGIPSSFTVVPRSGHALEAMSYEKSGPVFDTVVTATATQ